MSYAASLQRIRDIAHEQRRRKSPTDGQERVPITEGVGRIAACDHASPLSTPEFDSSAMDGFAISSAHTLSASPETPARFRVRGIVAAGEEPPVIPDGAVEDLSPAVEIMTGAKFPGHETLGEPFDACVKYEDMRYCPEQKGVILISKPVSRNANRRLAGEDIARGDVVLEAGQTIETTNVMPLASVAIDSVLVVKRPSVGILSTGKELVSGQATVRDVNGPFLTAACREAGASATFLGTLTDDLDTLMEEIGEITRQSVYDVLVSSGAVSAGKYDFIRTALEAIGAEVVVHGLAIRPGHPVILALLPSGKGKTAFFGLPGNPGAAAACFRFLVVPYLRELQGQPQEVPVRAKLSVPGSEVYTCNKGRNGHASSIDRFRHGVLKFSSTSGPTVALSEQQSPAKLQPYITSNCWAHIERDDVSEGDTVDCYPMLPRGWPV
ncbi:hypothetical protein DL770_010542 [Monosporascus sp. CRB-9-2]|nr:hypothetical protein DL770_010542 [Monosporascus sp. CRB-9-2]